MYMIEMKYKTKANTNIKQQTVKHKGKKLKQRENEYFLFCFYLLNQNKKIENKEKKRI